MEGLRLIAQSTFDKHQKFRSSNDSQRYNVIEIGAFELPQPPTHGEASTRYSNGDAHSVQSVSDGVQGANHSQDGDPRPRGAGAAGAGDSPTSHTVFNEWTVHEEDLVAFMKMRPVDLVEAGTDQAASQLEKLDMKKARAQAQAHAPGSGTASTMGHSRSVSLQSNKTASTSGTTATMATSPGKECGDAGKRKKQEIEAAASLKMVCIQRAVPQDSSSADTNTLAISREAFLRLFVDTMDADHGALYFIARDYDGFHEYNDTTRGIVTTFIGTADYALVWTFNRRSMEARGLFIERKRPGQPESSNQAPDAPSVARKKADITRLATSSAASGWVGFRDMIKMYRGYIYAPPLLSFVSCLHMIHSFDDQLSASDLPHVKEIEKKVSSGGAETPGPAGDSRAATTQPRNLALSRQSSAYATRLSTEPSFIDISPATPTQKPFNVDRLISWSQSSGEIADGAARKVRQVRMGREILEMIVRQHETVMADVVASSFLDRYHRAMQGMIEVIPAVERHMGSLEETLLDLKARTERLNGLISVLLSREQCGATKVDGIVPARSPLKHATLQDVMGSEDSDASEVKRVALMSTTLVPMTVFAAVIAIMVTRWSVIIPCMIFFFLGWSMVTQREWLSENMGHTPA